MKKLWNIVKELTGSKIKVIGSMRKEFGELLCVYWDATNEFNAEFEWLTKIRRKKFKSIQKIVRGNIICHNLVLIISDFEELTTF